MASLGQSQWDSTNCILVSADANSPIPPADDLKDYLQDLVSSLTQVTVKDTPNVGETFVYFDNEQAAQSVLGKPYHQMRTQIGYTYNFSVRSCPNIQATKYMKGDMASADSSETRQSHTGDGASAAMKDWDRKTIKVHGLKLSIRHDAIRSFFENKDLSGGGVTKEVDFDMTKGVAYVTFVHPGVAQTVLAKSGLQLYGNALTVSRAVGKDAPQGDTHGLEESRRPDGTRRQDVTRGQDESLRQGELRREDKSRKQAKSGVDRNRAAQKEWDGRTIQVTGLNPSTTGDAIVLVFESKLTNDEDAIQRVQRHPTKGLIYVTFTTAEAAQEVLSVPTFSLEGATLIVRPATGVKPQHLDPVQVGFSDPQDANKPKHVVVKHDESAQGAGKKVTPATKELCGPTIEVRGLKPSTRSSDVIKYFEELCVGRVDDVQRDSENNVTHVTFERKEDAQKALSTRRLSLEGAMLTVRPKQPGPRDQQEKKRDEEQEPTTGHSKLVVGISGTQNVRPRTVDQSGSATSSHPPEPEKATHRVVVLDLYQLRMLHAVRFITKHETEFPGMTVTIDTRGRNVTFGGKESDVDNAELAMHRLVDNMKSRSQVMSAGLIKLMRGITMIKHMVGVFKKKGIIAVYAAEGDTTLWVFAFDEAHLKKAIEVIKKETCDEPCAECTEALQTEEWAALKQDLQVKHEGLLTITESGDCIVLSGMVNPVADVKIQIHLLAASTDVKSDGSTLLDSVKRGGCTVQVVQGDLTTFRSEAIVNAANERLEHDGRLAKAIVHAGGQEIQRECRSYVSKNGYLKPGQVYVSTSGLLQCKKVIHAVGPMWHGGQYNEENILYGAVYEVLLAAEKHRLSSVALPALSSGNLRFPIDRCTEVIMRAVKGFLDTNLQTCVKTVSLVDKADNVLQEFRRSLGIMSDARSPPPSQTTTHRFQAPQPGTSLTHLKRPGVATRQSSVEGKDTSIQIGSLWVEVVQGDLTKESTDAIVNSCNVSLDLTTGATSKAIAKAGGPSIERECHKIGRIPLNGIAVTGAGELPCSCVYHIDAHKDTDWTGITTDVLTKANHQGISSIAFPALGTGMWQLSPHTAADNMLEAINRFNRSTPVKHLTLMRVVIFDKTMMESFRGYFMEKAAPHTDTQSHRTSTDETAQPHDSGHGEQRTDEKQIVGQAQWMYAEAGTFIDYPQDISHKLEVAFQTRLNTIELLDSIGRKHKFSMDVFVDETKKVGMKRIENHGAGPTRPVHSATGPAMPRTPQTSASAPGIGGGATAQVHQSVIRGATGGAVGQGGISPLLKIGPVNIEMAHGVLTNAYTDAICCSIKGLGLIKGTTGPYGIVSTPAGTLLCKWVLHTDEYMTPASIVKNVLLEADSHRLVSVSFTPVGNANEMLDAVEEFTRWRPHTTLRLIKIVIDNRDTLQSFRMDALRKAEDNTSAMPVFPADHRRVPPSQEQATTPSTPSHAGQHAPRPAVGAQSQPDSDGAVSNSGRAQQSTGRQPDVQVQWMYADADDDSYIQFVDVVNSTIERAYQNNQSKVEWQDTAGKNHKVSFKKLVYKINWTEKKLQRRLVFDGIVLGRWWTDMNNDESLKSESLDTGSSEYKEVKDKFKEFAGKSAYTINRITRIQNPELYRQYILCRDEIGKHCGHLPLVEKYLWHNTSRDLVNDINANGFRVTPILFTSNPSPDKSAARNTAVKKYVYLTRVVTGDCAVGQQGCTRAPVNKVTGRPYDSVRDATTKTYTVFSRYQAYPEYLISFW